MGDVRNEVLNESIWLGVLNDLEWQNEIHEYLLTNEGLCPCVWRSDQKFQQGQAAFASLGGATVPVIPVWALAI